MRPHRGGRAVVVGDACRRHSGDVRGAGVPHGDRLRAARRVRARRPRCAVCARGQFGPERRAPNASAAVTVLPLPVAPARFDRTSCFTAAQVAVPAMSGAAIAARDEHHWVGLSMCGRRRTCGRTRPSPAENRRRRGAVVGRALPNLARPSYDRLSSERGEPLVAPSERLSGGRSRNQPSVGRQQPVAAGAAASTPWRRHRTSRRDRRAGRLAHGENNVVRESKLGGE